MVAQILRRSNKKVLLVVNKVDTFDLQYQAAEFYKLGLGDPLILSAINGLGSGEVLDKLVKHFNIDNKEEIEELPRFAVVGRPNVGKSSLINAFIGENRHIVTDIAGTTRDSIYARYNKFGFDFYFGGHRRNTQKS